MRCPAVRRPGDKLMFILISFENVRQLMINKLTHAQPVHSRPPFPQEAKQRRLANYMLLLS